MRDKFTYDKKVFTPYQPVGDRLYLHNDNGDDKFNNFFDAVLFGTGPPEALPPCDLSDVPGFKEDDIFSE